MSHTPGPWGYSADEEDEGIEIAGHGVFIGTLETAWPCCEDSPEQQRAEGLANARLITAAPDLLALAQRVVEIFKPMHAKGQCGHTFELLLDRAEKCVIKATGEVSAT